MASLTGSVSMHLCLHASSLPLFHPKIWPNLPKSATDWTPSVKSYASMGIFFVRQGQTRATGTQQIQNLLITGLFITYNMKPKIAQIRPKLTYVKPELFSFYAFIGPGEAQVCLCKAQVKPYRPCYLTCDWKWLKLFYLTHIISIKPVRIWLRLGVKFAPPMGIRVKMGQYEATKALLKLRLAKLIKN